MPRYHVRIASGPYSLADRRTFFHAFVVRGVDADSSFEAASEGARLGSGTGRTRASAVRRALASFRSQTD